MRFIRGYRIIDVPVGIGAVLHSLYLKEHNKDATKGVNTKGRVLFVGNVDYVKDRSLAEIDGYLRMLLGAYGVIESVSVSEYEHEKEDNDDDDDNDEIDAMKRIEPTSYSFGNVDVICGLAPDHSLSRGSSCSTSSAGRMFESRFAHVVFAEKNALKACLAASDTMYYGPTKQVAARYGAVASECHLLSAKDLYKQRQYRWPVTSDLQTQAEEFMQSYDEEEHVAKLDRDKRAREPDDDGFVLVKTKNKKRRTEEKRGTGAPRDREGAKKKTKETKELKHFYRFQMRDEKQKQLVDLRQRFQQDQAKIAAMKAARKFNPFG